MVLTGPGTILATSFLLGPFDTKIGAKTGWRWLTRRTAAKTGTLRDRLTPRVVALLGETFCCRLPYLQVLATTCVAWVGPTGFLSLHSEARLCGI